MVMDVKPTTKTEQDCLDKFLKLTPEQRAEVIMLGFQKLKEIWQREADKVSGYNG